MVCESHGGVVLADGVWVTLGVAQRRRSLLDEVTGSAVRRSPRTRCRRCRTANATGCSATKFFADWFTGPYARGRRSVPTSIVATVIVLQKLGGLWDREAVERFTFDARWRYAAGSAAGTAGRSVSRTRCWSTCVPGCAARLTGADQAGDDRGGRRCGAVGVASGAGLRVAVRRGQAARRSPRVTICAPASLALSSRRSSPPANLYVGTDGKGRVNAKRQHCG